MSARASLRIQSASGSCTHRHRGGAESYSHAIRRLSGPSLAGALCVTLCAVTGITNMSLRPDDRTARRRLRHDAGQLRLAGLRHDELIVRRPHTNAYDLTRRRPLFALFYARCTTAS